MKRTQLYLEEDLWKTLHLLSKSSGSSISELVRQAVRDRYRSMAAKRKEAMQGFVGIWRDRTDLADAEAYVRRLRRGARRRRMLR